MRKFAGEDRGNVAVVSAAAFLAVAAGVGGAANVTRFQGTGSRLQDVADAAALAGAVQSLQPGATPADVKSMARKVAASMLAADAQVSVSMNTGGPAPEVTVQASQPVNVLFGGVFGKNKSTVTRKATAIGGQKKPVCLLVLDPSGSGVWSMSGTPDLIAPKCVAQVNSKSATAVTSNGNGTVNTLETKVVGEKGGSGGNFRPAPVYRSNTLADPLAARVKWPLPGVCNYVNLSVSKGAQTRAPGAYCGGINVPNGGTLTLSPGVHVIQTGSLTVKGTIKAPGGVTIVMIDPLATFDIKNGTVEIDAPKTGTWRGIALAVKPQPTILTSSMQGGGELKLNGMVYLPSQTLHVTGGGSMSGSLDTRVFVVNRIQMQGNGQIVLNGDSSLMGIPGSVRLKS